MKLSDLISQYEKGILSHHCNIEYLERRLANLTEDASEELIIDTKRGITFNWHSVNLLTDIINDLKQVTEL